MSINRKETDRDSRHRRDMVRTLEKDCLAHFACDKSSKGAWKKCQHMLHVHRIPDTEGRGRLHTHAQDSNHLSL